MAKISFAKGFADITIAPGSNLMKTLLAHNLPVGSSCGGEGLCTKCLIKVIAGGKNLSAPNKAELLLKEKHLFSSDYRVSCQCEVLGDITIDADYW